MVPAITAQIQRPGQGFQHLQRADLVLGGASAPSHVNLAELLIVPAQMG